MINDPPFNLARFIKMLKLLSSFESLCQGRDAAVAPIPVEAVETLDPHGRIVAKICPDTTALAGGGRRRSQPGGDRDCSWRDGGASLVPESRILN